MTQAAGRLVGRLRNTKQGAAVQEVLQDADGFRSAQELFDELRRRGSTVGLATVYRYLNLFAEHGSADVVRRDDGETQFRLCGSPSEPGAGRPTHHHHLVCRVCGRSVEVASPEVEAWAERVAAAAGFTEITHTVEVFGLCREHSPRLAAAAAHSHEAGQPQRTRRP